MCLCCSHDDVHILCTKLYRSILLQGAQRFFPQLSYHIPLYVATPLICLLEETFPIFIVCLSWLRLYLYTICLAISFAMHDESLVFLSKKAQPLRFILSGVILGVIDTIQRVLACVQIRNLSLNHCRKSTLSHSSQYGLCCLI